MINHHISTKFDGLLDGAVKALITIPFENCDNLLTYEQIYNVVTVMVMEVVGVEDEEFKSIQDLKYQHFYQHLRCILLSG